MHRHKWLVIKREERLSTWELLGATEARWISPDILRRKLIVTYKCDKCGTEKVRVLYV